MNVLQLVQVWEHPHKRQMEKAGYKHFFMIPASILYPTMIEEILQIIKEGEEKARELIRGNRLEKTPIFSQYLSQALRVHNVGWQAALAAPFDEMAEDVKQHRDSALTVTRLWFTELLHTAVHNAPMVFRIMRDEENRYRPSVRGEKTL